MKDIKEIPPVYLGLIGILAIGAIGFFGFRAMSGPSYPAIPTMKDAYQSIDDLARKSQGDYSKLSPQEQASLDSFARGHGKEYLAHRYKIITTGGK
jgi:hypothetical protein